MATTLEEALSDVELEDGRTYAVRIRGRDIEVRVKPLTGPLIVEDRGQMVSAWTDLIRSGEGTPCPNRPGRLPIFPPPEIPSDEVDR